MQTNKNSIVGKTLRNRYKITNLLSADIQGGQGQVYFAKDNTAQIEKKYIVKQFIPNYKNTLFLEVGTRLFTQEAEILQKLGSHSQIPQILDYFTHNKQFFLVQEWIDGQNIQQELDVKKQLSESEVVALLKDTTEVLSFVHQNGYIHRDIKPANLIRNKYDRKIYLIDFGAVKEKIRPENIDDRGNVVSAPTLIIGTSGYMPTEQLRGMPEFSSDIYALGMVAIQGITGIHPTSFDLDNQNNPIWREHITTQTNSYSKNLLNLIDRMVRGYHKERYQSATEVLNDLNQLRLNPKASIGSSFKGDLNVFERLTSKPQKSLFPWIVGVLSTVMVGFGGVFLLGNTEKYVAYENSEYGIKLDRPEKWSIEENWNSLDPQVGFLSALEDNQDEFREHVIVSVESLSSPLTLNEYTKEVTKQIERSNAIFEPVKETTFANKEGRKIIYQEKDGNRKRMQIWTIKNQKAYIATYTAEVDNFDKFAKQAEKIIKSLAINN